VETILRAGLSNAVVATVLALVVACLTRPLARRPAVLHFLWVLVLWKLVTPPLYEVPLAWPESWAGARATPAPGTVCRLATVDRSTARAAAIPETVDSDGFAIASIVVVPGSDLGRAASSLGKAAEAVPRPGVWSSIEWARPLAVLWVAGAVGALFVSGRRVRRFQHLLDAAQRGTPDDQDWVDELATVLEVRRSPSLWWIAGKLSPMIWPLGRRPRLIIPGDLWKTLDPRQRTTLVLHELAHLRRGDHWLRFFELFVTALYWWHPLVWFVRHALRDAEEACCDAWVVWAVPESAKSYAETLLETLDFLNQCDQSEPLLASGFGKVDHLRRRLTMIMSGATPRRLGTWGALGALGLAAVLLPVGATWAQKPEKPQEVQVVVKTIDVTGDGDAVVRLETETDSPQHSVAGVIAALEDAPEGRITLRLKTDDSPELVVSGPVDEAIAKLKKQIGEIVEKSPRSEQDEARVKALKQAIDELLRIADQIKRSKPGEPGEEKKAVVLRLAPENLKKPIGPEQKAAIEKARVAVKELTWELEAKRKELMEARARLAKLEGGPASVYVVRSDNKVVRGEPAKPLIVSPKHVLRSDDKTVIVERREVHRSDEKAPTHGEAKKVEPSPRRVRIEAEALKVLPDLPVKPGSVGIGVARSRSDNQRIEELERTLKKLIDEVDSLKKDRAKEGRLR
jgi:beta-lactamase regulating signal transducer with metallopeptidase domain